MDLSKHLAQFARLRAEVLSKLNEYPVLQKHSRAISIAGIGVSLLLLRIVYKKIVNIIRKSPPELYGLPFIGSALTMVIWKNNFREVLVPKYGDLVTYSIGNMKFYKINNIDLANQVLSRRLQSTRPSMTSIAYKKANLEPDVVMVNKDWEYRRKKLMSSLSIVLNSNKLESALCKILKNVTFDNFDSQLENNDKFLWYPRKSLHNTTFNVIYLAMFGKMLALDDPLFDEYNDAVELIRENLLGGWMAAKISNKTFKYVSGLTEKEQLFQLGARNLHKLIKNDFQRSTGKTSDNNKDNNGNDAVSDGVTSLAQCYANDESLIIDVIIADLQVVIEAGKDTTGHTSEIGILILAKYPKIEEMVYNELIKVFGERNDDNDDVSQFSLSKIHELHLFRAFIHEALRIAIPVPDSAPRTCNKDLRCMKLMDSDGNQSIKCDFAESKSWDGGVNDKIIYDYIIEKDCIIEPNLVFISKCNKQLWNLNNDPMVIDLNYWLDDETKKFRYNKNSIPFSVGARDCAGQGLALRNLYALFGHLIIKYKVSAQNNDQDGINFDYKFGEVAAALAQEMPVEISKRLHL